MPMPCMHAAIIIILLSILSFRYALAFLTPALPFVPAIAITVNIYLIFKLSILTLVRFTIWMTLGLIMYFYYGITHSSLENPTEEIELTVDTSYLEAQPQPRQHNSEREQPTAVWDRHGYENKMAEDSWSSNKYSNNWDPSNSWAQPSANNVTYHHQPVPAPKLPPSKPKAAPTRSSAQPPASAAASSSSSATTTQHKRQQQMKEGGFGSIFVDESEFPTWDD